MRDDDSFDRFYAATAQRLTRDIYLATGDLGRAQDCVQEAFLRAWRRWDTLAATGDPAGWVYTVAWRLAVSDWRRMVRQARLLVRHGPLPDAPPPSTDVIAVREALALLPKDQRVALVLHHLQDLPVAHIAELLRTPEGTVKARLSQGRSALAALLTDATDPTERTPKGATTWTT